MCYDTDAESMLDGALARGNSEYFNEMRRLLSKHRTSEGYAGVAMRIFELYGDRLSSGEKAWFRALVAKYLKNKVSRDALLDTLELFAVRMSDWKTADQTVFAPYPQELVPDVDQRLDRDYWKAVSIQ
ncbi:DUF1722 domain-containing protein [Methanocella paludicola]|nr:DUF1722 domain-containing protein [Methanocella paludicola]